MRYHEVGNWVSVEESVSVRLVNKDIVKESGMSEGMFSWLKYVCTEEGATRFFVNYVCLCKSTGVYMCFCP